LTHSQRQCSSLIKRVGNGRSVKQFPGRFSQFGEHPPYFASRLAIAVLTTPICHLAKARQWGDRPVNQSQNSTERNLIRPQQKVIGTKFASATRDNTIAFQVEEYVLEKFSRYALRFSNVSDPHGMSSAGKCDDRAECISSPLRDHRSPGVSPAHLELDPVLLSNTLGEKFALSGCITRMNTG